jgi:hypothetical protein
MRVRTGHGPDDWSPNVPAPVVSSTARSAAYALQVGEMVPIMGPGPLPLSNSDIARNQRRKVRVLATHMTERPPRPLRPRCGFVMPWVQQPCARRVGHKWDHRHAAAIAADNARKRSA